MNTEIHNIFELENWVNKNLLNLIKDGTLVLLNGPLGAGKTEIVKIVSRLMMADQVQSPTFAFHNRYKTKSGLNMHHIDLYRLKNEDDLESIGFWDLLNEESGVFFIEWADLIKSELWPINKKIVSIDIDKVQNDLRKISMKFD